MFEVIKGMSAPWDFKTLRSYPNALEEILLSVCHTLECKRKEEEEGRESYCSPGVKKVRAQISNYISALQNEWHSLAILIDMMQYIIAHRMESQFLDKDGLYLQTLVESYFTSLRAIFDYVSVVYKIAVEEKHLGKIPSRDSFNDTIEFMKKDTAKNCVPPEVIRMFLEYQSLFEGIRKIRDLIIHRGKEPVVYRTNDGYHFALYKNMRMSRSNVLQDILDVSKDTYPLLPYLSKLTNQVVEFTSRLGAAIYDCAVAARGSEIELILLALEGVCIPNFKKFLKITSNNVVSEQEHS
jgi:hypothetical protein